MSEIESYLKENSPISRLVNKKGRPLKDIKNSFDDKFQMMEAGKKNYLIDHTTSSYSDLKASSIIYNVPEFSSPETNFEVSQKIKEKINEIKSELVTKLPAIKSSNYNPNKLDAFMSHRTVVKELQEWLRVKLQDPPTTLEDSIEYKNMIMGIGMKEVIRLIGTRCTEEANMVNEIWELTWGICREIILYLSKRAKKCESILNEEIGFIRKFYDGKLTEQQQKIKGLFEENKVYRQRNDKLSKQNSHLKKKNKELKIRCFEIDDLGLKLKEEFENILKENLTLHLNSNNKDSKKMDWVRRTYLNMVGKDKRKNSQFSKYLEKIMIENHYISESQEFGDFELKGDVNAIRQEEEARKSFIDQQLHETFKKVEKFSQTQNKQFVDISQMTDRKEYFTCEINTERPETSEVSVNTEDTQIKSQKKTKQVPAKPQKALKTEKGLGKVDKTKKKVQMLETTLNNEIAVEVVPKTYPKSSMYVQTEGYATEIERSSYQNEYITSIAHSKKFVNSSFHSEKSKFEDEQEALLKTLRNDTENKGIQKSIKNKESENKTENSGISGRSMNFGLADGEQQQKIEKLRQKIIEMETHFGEKLEQSKKILAEKNSMIVQLTRQNKEKDETLKKHQNDLHEANMKADETLSKIENASSNISPSHLVKSHQVIHKSIPSSSKRINDSEITKFHSQHRGSHLSFLQALNENRNENNVSNFGESPTEKTSKAQSVVEYFSKELQQKSESEIEGKKLSFQELCYEYLDEMVFQKQGNRPTFIPLPEGNMDQYRQTLKIVLDDNYDGNEKHTKLILEKTAPFLLRELSKQIHQGIKLNKLSQLRAHYNQLPTIMMSRFNRNFGVKKVAQKHLKDFLLSLKRIQKSTKKYSVLWYFLRNPEKSQANTDLLFFYFYLCSLHSSYDKILTFEEFGVIKQLAQQHLINSHAFLDKISTPRFTNEGDENSLTQVFKSIIIAYHEFTEEREKEILFIYKSLTWTNPRISLELLVDFLSLFSQRWEWHNSVLKEVASILQFEKSPEINRKIFFQIFNKCPQLSLEKLSQQLNEQVSETPEMSESQLLEMGKKSELSANFVVSIITSRKDPSFFAKEQVDFLKKYIASKETEKHVLECLGSLSFFEARNNGLLLGIMNENR